MPNELNHRNSIHDSCRGIFLRFLRFGLLAWGGPEQIAQWSP